MVKYLVLYAVKHEYDLEPILLRFVEDYTNDGYTTLDMIQFVLDQDAKNNR